MFVNAGQETTRNSLTAGMAELIRDPDQMRRLRNDRELLRTLPDEFVRWRSPVAHVLRTATADMQFGGQTVREGDWVVAWIASANRDEAAFDEPDRFDIGRDPNPHLGFGLADHFCLGAIVARLQLRRIMTAFLDHVEEIDLIGPIEHVASHQFWGFKRMPVRVTPMRRAAA
jgi:cytochrome P450